MKPGPTYSLLGDFVSYYIRDVDCFAESVDETLTLYRDDSTGEVVGCKIKGVNDTMNTVETALIAAALNYRKATRSRDLREVEEATRRLLRACDRYEEENQEEGHDGTQNSEA